LKNATFRIATFEGDGIGHEIMPACLHVLEALQRRIGGFRLEHEKLEGGAELYRDRGTDITDEAFEAARQADAILFAAMGLPDVRFPDGTEIAPHLRMRLEFGLFAGLRPARSFPNAPGPLKDPRAANIDVLVIRESTEGLFASRGKGVLIDDREARDTMVITRATCEKLFDKAFELARLRKKAGRPGIVTCVDKSNVFVSMAFFRKVFDERAQRFPDIIARHHYIDATALDLVRRPWDFDVLVMENMFGDIISDLAGGLVGGMGMAPCAEIGDAHGLFQPAHGTAPDIAGKGIANPTAMFLSAAMMLDWLGSQHDAAACHTAASLLVAAVENVFSEGRHLPRELGGTAQTNEVASAVADAVRTVDPDGQTSGGRTAFA
jgi:3-isopropylmalate dehydrogenase